MRFPWLWCAGRTWLAFGFCLFASLLCRGEEPLPPVEEVIRRFIERSQTNSVVEEQTSYRCTRQTVTEDMDSDGHIKNRKVKIRETQSRASGPGDARKWSTSNGFSLDASLLRRYTFTLAGVETLNERPAYLLKFVPKVPPAPIRRFQDHLLNRVAGTLWIDQQDYELVKAQLRLEEPVSFGIIGAVDTLTFAFERARSNEGGWLTKWTETYVKARKFLTPLQTRKRVEWSDFHPANAEG